jgi:hypothetical protein
MFSLAPAGAFGFGAPASTAAFGFGAAAPAPAFGAAAPASASAFAFPASTTSTTSPPSSFAGFGAATPQMFGGTPLQPAPAGGGFGQPGQPQVQPGGQQPGLVTYSTRYDDLPADKQMELQGIQ